MYRLRTVAAAALAMLAIGTAVPSAHAGSRSRMARAINQARAWTHVHHLRMSARLSSGAAGWARHLMRRHMLAHSSRALSHGEGEIIEWHASAAARVRQVVHEWLASPEHRDVMLAGDYRRIGAGRAVGYMYGHRSTIWVVRFAH